MRTRENNRQISQNDILQMTLDITCVFTFLVKFDIFLGSHEK